MEAWTHLLEERLDEMLQHPGDGHDGWWGSREAYELQVLLLLELRYFPSNRVGLMERYIAFLRSRFPTVGCRPLFVLRKVDLQTMARVLADFRNDMKAA